MFKNLHCVVYKNEKKMSKLESKYFPLISVPRMRKHTANIYIYLDVDIVRNDTLA